MYPVQLPTRKDSLVLLPTLFVCGVLLCCAGPLILAARLGRRVSAWCQSNPTGQEVAAALPFVLILLIVAQLK